MGGCISSAPSNTRVSISNATSSIDKHNTSSSSNHIREHRASTSEFARPVFVGRTIEMRKREREEARKYKVQWWKEHKEYISINDINTDIKYDATNDKHWNDFLLRQHHAQDDLIKLKLNTKPIIREPLADKNLVAIRPFLSSTFRDFTDERDFVFQHAFSKIEQICNRHGLFFSALDLRWGVTSEQSSSGEVVKICLNEIDRSRPFFIAFLGFRNGWCLPKDLASDLLLSSPKTRHKRLHSNEGEHELLLRTLQTGSESFPWVNDYLNRSVTEIEILHGALNVANKGEHRIFFYFRDVEYLEELPQEKRNEFCELGYGEQLLYSLKKRIIETGFNVEFFHEGDELSDLIESAFLDEIELDFPQLKSVEESERVSDKLDHTIFAERMRHMHVQNIIMQNKLSDICFEQAEQKGTIVLVSGEQGGGCSAFLANWVTSQNDIISQCKGRIVIIERYIGANTASIYPPLLLRSIMNELKSQGLMNSYIPQEDKEILRVFPIWLRQAASNIQSIILIIDDLMQLDEKDDAQHMFWLPNRLPKNVVVITSTKVNSINYNCLLQRRLKFNIQVIELNLPALNEDQCKRITVEWLQFYGKQLDREQLNKVLKCKVTRNPLYLVTFLQELRSFGVYEKVNETIDYYLESNDVISMFDKVLCRLEIAFNQEAPGLVKHTLCLMYVSRRGLSDNELKCALEVALGVSVEEKSFPVLELSAILLRLDQSLSTQRGVRKFAHPSLADAVRRRYINDDDNKTDKNQEATKKPFHQILATFFMSQNNTLRKAQALPYHLFNILKYHVYIDGKNSSHVSNAKEELIVSLCELNLIEFYCQKNLIFDLHMYWKYIEELHISQGNKNLTASLACIRYNDVLTKEFRFLSSSIEFKDDKKRWLVLAKQYENIANFLMHTARYGEVEKLYNMALDIHKKFTFNAKIDEHIEELLTKKANLLVYLNRFKESIPLYKEALDIVLVRIKIEETKKSERKLEKLKIQLCDLRRSLADVMKEDVEKLMETEELYVLVIHDLISLVGRKDEHVANANHNLAELYLRMRKPEKALRLFQESLETMQVLYGAKNLEVATIMSSYAGCYADLNQYDKSVELYTESINMKSELMGKNHVSLCTSLTNLSQVFMKQKKYSEACDVYKQLMDIQNINRDVLMKVMYFHGCCLYKLNKYTAALESFEKSYLLYMNVYEKKDEDKQNDMLSFKAKLLSKLSEVLLLENRIQESLSYALYGIEAYNQQQQQQQDNQQDKDKIPIYIYISLLHTSGRAYEEQSEYQDALDKYNEQVELIRDYNLPKKQLGDALMCCGYILCNLDRHQQAKDVFKLVLDIRIECSVTPDDNDVKEVCACINQLEEDDDEEDEEDEEDEGEDN